MKKKLINIAQYRQSGLTKKADAGTGMKKKKISCGSKEKLSKQLPQKSDKLAAAKTAVAAGNKKRLTRSQPKTVKVKIWIKEKA